MKYTLILVSLILVFGCQPKISKDKALNRLDETLSQMVIVKKNIDSLDHNLSKLAKKIIYENNNPIDKSAIEKLRLSNEKAIVETISSIEKLEALPEISSRIKLRDEAVLFFKTIRNVQENHVPKIIELMENGISENNIEELRDELKEFSKLRDMNKSFASVQQAYYAEHNLNDDEINPIFQKNGL